MLNYWANEDGYGVWMVTFELAAKQSSFLTIGKTDKYLYIYTRKRFSHQLVHLHSCALCNTKNWWLSSLLKKKHWLMLNLPIFTFHVFSFWCIIWLIYSVDFKKANDDVCWDKKTDRKVVEQKILLRSSVCFVIRTFCAVMSHRIRCEHTQ